MAPTLQRNASASSVMTTTASSAASTGSIKKSSRAKDLLRDYYGLQGPAGSSGDKANGGGGDVDPMNLG